MVIELRKRGRIYKYNKDSLNYFKAKDLFTEAYSKGDLKSLVELADMYYTGFYQDILKAEQLYSILSEKEYPEGLYHMGIGLLLNNNAANGFPYVNKAAEKNYLPAITLAAIYKFTVFQSAIATPNLLTIQEKREEK